MFFWLVGWLGFWKVSICSQEIVGILKHVLQMLNMSISLLSSATDSSSFVFFKYQFQMSVWWPYSATFLRCPTHLDQRRFHCHQQPWCHPNASESTTTWGLLTAHSAQIKRTFAEAMTPCWILWPQIRQAMSPTLVGSECICLALQRKQPPLSRARTVIGLLSFTKGCNLFFTWSMNDWGLHMWRLWSILHLLKGDRGIQKLPRNTSVGHANPAIILRPLENHIEDDIESPWTSAISTSVCRAAWVRKSCGHDPLACYLLCLVGTTFGNFSSVFHLPKLKALTPERFKPWPIQWQAWQAWQAVWGQVETVNHGLPLVLFNQCLCNFDPGNSFNGHLFLSAGSSTRYV